MKDWKFDRLVQARADAQVQQKIKKCKLGILNAIRELLGAPAVQILDPSLGYFSDAESSKKILQILSSDNWSKGWPRLLWDREEQKVAEEILGMMQPMERALRDLERVPEADECQPEKENEEQTAPT